MSAWRRRSGAGAVDLATAKELRFGLAVAPLLSGKVQLTEVALISPILTMPEAQSRQDRGRRAK